MGALRPLRAVGHASVFGMEGPFRVQNANFFGMGGIAECTAFGL